MLASTHITANRTGTVRPVPECLTHNRVWLKPRSANPRVRIWLKPFRTLCLTAPKPSGRHAAAIASVTAAGRRVDDEVCLEERARGERRKKSTASRIACSAVCISTRRTRISSFPETKSRGKTKRRTSPRTQLHGRNHRLCGNRGVGLID